MIEDVAINNTAAWPVWGHSHAVKELVAASIRGPRHAYILSGFDHLGKSTLAMLFAQSLLCDSPLAPGVPCLECRSCKRVAKGTHPDCSLWDLERQQQSAEKASTAKNLTLNIQTVRGITSSLAMRPLESRYRLAIVDDVETMQETAQEAFLKTLEEPPSYAVILLLTTDAELLLETIRSRAMTIPLQTVPLDIVERGLLTHGAASEKARQLAEASDGRPGWAIRALTDEKMLTERLEQKEAAASWISGDRYHQLVEATKLGEAFGKDRAAVYARLSAVQSEWRLRLLDEVESGNAAASLKALKSIDTCFSDLDANVRPKLALQTMVLQWPTSNP